MGRSSNYSNQMYQQLQEIMERLNSVEQDLKKEKIEHKEDVERLEKLIVEKDKKINEIIWYKSKINNNKLKEKTNWKHNKIETIKLKTN